MTEAELIKAIERHAKKRRIAPATVTSQAVGNSRLYSNLKSGKTCSLRVARRICEYIDSIEKAPDFSPSTEGAK